MAENYFPPETPRSAEDIYQKLREDSDYVDFIQRQLATARTGTTEEERADAVAVLDSHFALSTDELTLLKLPANFSAGKCACTNTRTTFFLLDFATAAATIRCEESAE